MAVSPKAWAARQIERFDGWLLKSTSTWAALGSSLVALALLIKTADVLPDAAKLELATEGSRLGCLITKAGSATLISHLRWDAALIVAYVVAMLLLAALVNTPDKLRLPARLTVYGVVIGAGLMDGVEDLGLWRASTQSAPSDRLALFVSGASIIKWSLLLALVVAALVALGQRLRIPFDGAAPTTGVQPFQTMPAWAPPPEGGRVGISCSGGGIRSATFCLGALHGLGEERVRGADYLSAASGGAYMAAAMTAHAMHRVDRLDAQVLDAVLDISASQPTAGVAPEDDPGALLEAARSLAVDALQPSRADAELAAGWAAAFAARAQALEPTGGGALASATKQVAEARHEPLPFGQIQGGTGTAADSAELRRLRARASYLLLSGGEGRISVARAVSGLVVNLLVLWLVLFAVARPVGYAMSSTYLHPELRAKAPLFHDIHLPADLAVGDLEIGRRRPVECADGSGPGEQVSIGLTTGDRPVQFAYSGATTTVSPSTIAWETSQRRLLVPEQAGVVEVCGGRVQVLQQPTFALTPETPIEVDSSSLLKPAVDIAPPGPLDGIQLRSLLKIDRQPTFAALTQREGRDKISIDPWMWWVVVGALIIVITSTTFGRGVLRGDHDVTTQLPATAALAATVGAVVLVVGIALPWACQELPRRFGDAASHLPGAASGVNGLVAWLAGALLAARTTLAGATKQADAKTAKSKKRGKLVLKVGATVLLGALGFIALFSIVQIPVLNGPNGRLTAFDLYWTGYAPPDWAKLVVAGAVLLVLRRWVATHLWSLHPFYRDRLGKAFLGDVRDLDVPADVRQATILGEPQAKAPWPQLVICGAINVNATEPPSREIPAGRWADSFTFSREAIGSPTTGFVTSTAYAEALNRGRNRTTDLQLSSLVAVAGAAFSPGMGKEAYGAVGGLFALLNLRLGLWLPNPKWLRTNDSWRVRPGWPYLLREFFGRFRSGDRFVYVTDGGHWENLGLVELIRRGCTEIYVLSAAGDGKLSSSTIGEALALAREEFGVDIDVELTPLRARVGSELTKTGRQLISQEDDDANLPFAPSPFAVGWFTYSNGVRARILFIEANLTNDMPWDVHSHAERHSMFPDDSTANQFFNHRQFESYRRLGTHQATQAAESTAWTVLAAAWAAGNLTTEELRGRLAERGLA